MNRSFPIFYLFLIFIFSSFHFMDTYVKKSELSFFLLSALLLQSFAKLLLSFSSFVFSWSLDAAAATFCQLLLLCDDFFVVVDNLTSISTKIWYFEGCFVTNTQKFNLFLQNISALNSRFITWRKKTHSSDEMEKQKEVEIKFIWNVDHQS